FSVARKSIQEARHRTGQVRAVVDDVTVQTGREDDLEAALDAARSRGDLRVAEILAGEDMLSADEFARRVGATRVTVNDWRKRRRVLGLEGAKRGYRFPVWQIGNDGKPFAAIPDLFDRLGGSPWAVYRF